MRILGLIPARGGSKGVHRKNVRLLGGKPLLQYSVEAAYQSRLLTRTILSTDDAEIASIGATLGIDVPFIRPATLAEDRTPMVAVMLHALTELHKDNDLYDIVVLLQPTTPLRLASDIDEAIQLLLASGANSVASVTLVPEHYHPRWQFVIEDKFLKLYTGEPVEQIVTARQLLSPTYRRNGAVYVVRSDFLLKHKTILSSDLRAYIMPESRSVNIDSEFDFQIAELMLRLQSNE